MKGIKWTPILLMALVLGLGCWLVWAPSTANPTPRPGARKTDIRIGNARGIVEVMPAPPGREPTFRVLLRDGHASEEIPGETLRGMIGDRAYAELATRPSNALFQLLNITSWAALVWVVLGFMGQVLFAGRTFVQWVVSEKRRESVVPEGFWWMSLGGGLLLFTYFIWRQDIVGVIGQSSGLVIYARNLRLIYKRRNPPA